MGSGLIFVIVIAFIIGLLLSLSTAFWNREHRKKGFRCGEFYGAGKDIDDKFEKEFLEMESQKKDILEDDMEYYANKRFK